MNLTPAALDDPPAIRTAPASARPTNSAPAALDEPSAIRTAPASARPTNSTPADPDDPPVIRAGWAEEAGEGCVTLDPAAVLKATRRSFVLRVRGQSMIGAGICDGDLVVGEFTPEARPGAIVVALIDGESTLKRLVLHHGRPCLAAENPNFPDFVPLSELVIQGTVHTVVKRVR